MTLPRLKVFENAVSIAHIARTLEDGTNHLIDFAEKFYGEKSLRVGDHIGRLINMRMSLSEYGPYIDDIAQTVNIFDDRLGVRTLQHSVSLGCSTIVRDVTNDNGDASPAVMGTVDWEQVGDNLSSVVSLAVLDNPIKPESPIVSAAIGPASFGLIMMNNQAVAKLNRAPLPNIKDKGIDLTTISEDEYKAVKKRNNMRYMLKTSANAIFRGRPPSAYLLRHAINKDMSFDDTVDFIKNTAACDFAIITVAGTKPGEAVTIEKRGDESYVYSGYEAATNHWKKDGDFGHLSSLPRTLNSEFRACSMADTSLPSIFKDDRFGFANRGVVDHTTRIVVEANPASGEISLLTTHGGKPTSQGVSARFDGEKLNAVEHFMPDLA